MHVLKWCVCAQKYYGNAVTCTCMNVHRSVYVKHDISKTLTGVHGIKTLVARQQRTCALVSFSFSLSLPSLHFSNQLAQNPALLCVFVVCTLC